MNICFGSFRNVKHFFKKVLGLKDNKYCSEMWYIYMYIYMWYSVMVMEK